MVDAGMSPKDAILSATLFAADLLGEKENLGSIEPGKYADIVAVSSDPLEDIKVLETIDFVMKGGEVIKQPLKFMKLYDSIGPNPHVVRMVLAELE